MLADFGINPKARAPLTVEAKAAAAAKRAATRAARHTMGSQQKKAIKGDVTGVLVTPITSTPGSRRDGTEWPDDPRSQRGSDGCEQPAQWRCGDATHRVSGVCA